MNTLYIIMIGISLSMDACAVIFSYSLNKINIKFKEIIFICLLFGLFQGLMPYFGYSIFNNISKYFIIYSKYITFIILSIIGLSMILSKEDSYEYLDIKKILLLSIATSIDAFIIGTTFTFYNYDIILSSIIISIITFILTIITSFIAKKINKISKYNTKIIGGIILILLGLKELLF